MRAEPRSRTHEIDEQLKQSGFFWRPEHIEDVTYVIQFFADNLLRPYAYPHAEGGQAHTIKVIGHLELIKLSIAADEDIRSHNIGGMSIAKANEDLRKEGLGWYPETPQLFAEYLQILLLTPHLSVTDRLGILYACQMYLMTKDPVSAEEHLQDKMLS